MEESGRKQMEKGTPQGDSTSPLLSNVYLHSVLDLWFERKIKSRILQEGTSGGLRGRFCDPLRRGCGLNANPAHGNTRFGRYHG